MEYRLFDKIGKPVSLFGIGCMRLPTTKVEGKNVIDEPEAIRMIRYGIDHGVNYIDTAYPYHDGTSELLVAKALKDGYREKVFLATKSPVWLVHEYSDLERLLDEQLRKLETDSIDFYLLHALNKERWTTLKAINAMDFMEKAKEQGKIKHICFSFHDNAEAFREIIDGYDWDMCQIQMNIMDMHDQATVEGLKYAGSKNIPVVIMEPLKGGKLATSVNDDIRAIWNQSEVKRTPVEWAFRWLYNFPQVMTILSGVSTMEQLQDNLQIFAEAKAGSMDENELSLVDQVREVYHKKTVIPCTSCEYCLPCPQGVYIPGVFGLVNEAAMYDDENGPRNHYRDFIISENADASHCVECGQCEAACPQQISIISKLKESHRFLVQK